MSKKPKSNLIRRNEKSSATPISKSNKSQSNKTANRKKQPNEQKTSFGKAIDSFVELMCLVVVLIVVFILFSISIKFFSILYKLFGVTILSSAFLALVCKFVKYLKLGKNFFTHPIVKTIAEVCNSVKSIFKKFYNRNAMSKNLCIVIVLPIIVSFVISFFPKISAHTNEAIDNVWNKIGVMIGDNIINSNNNSDNDNNKDAESTISNEEIHIASEAVSYPAKMTFIIQSEKYSYEISSNLISEAYLYSAEKPWEYFNAIYKTKKANPNTDAYYIVRNEEDAFIEKVNEGIEYKMQNGQNDTWYNMLPKEEDLHLIINHQEEIAEKYPSYLIYNCLSNNYQRLALEYYNQGKNAEAIKYLYLMSIKFEIKSMEYATVREQFYIAAERITTRYKDILFCCNCTSDEISYLQKLLNLLKS